MGAKPKNKCLHCELPVYAKHLCRRHYKKLLAIKNGTYKKDYQRRKVDPKFMERKRMMDQLYREKKKLGIDTTRKTNDNALCNQDWRSYFNSWHKSSSAYKMKGIKNASKYKEYRLKIIEHYSGGKNCCARCGIEDVRVLDMDHINNDGAEQRRKLGQLNLVHWVIKNNFPDGFQILCRNCNWLKELERREKDNIKRWT
jgi:hypothetical protein